MLFTISSIDFQPLSLTIVTPGLDVKYTIRNQKNGIFGKLLTNGFSISAAQSDSFDYVSICLPLAEERSDYSPATTPFPVLDLASKYPHIVIPHSSHSGNNNLFTVYNVSVENNGNVFCTNLSNISVDVHYYIIERVKDWEDSTSQVLSRLHKS